MPTEGSIAAQNNLLPHLILRDEGIYSITKGYRVNNPDIIVFDLSQGQSPNNFYPETYDFLVKEVKLIEKTKMYKRIDTGNENFYIYQRIN